MKKCNYNYSNRDSLAPFGQAVSEEKIFFNISQSEKRINLGDHVCRPNGTKWRNFIEDLT
jgi:hypothetical protein